MNSFVKNAFFTIMACVVATVLYFIFFGWGNGDQFMSASGQLDSKTVTSNFRFKGVLFIAGETVEDSIARYYYEYCYLPNIHVNDGMDANLGLKPYYTGNKIQDTPSYLGKDMSGNYVELCKYDRFGEGFYYDTGWN